MRLKSLHHVVFTVTNLDETERFAQDFGLKTARKSDGALYMRTTGGDAYVYVARQGAARAFHGYAFLAEDISDLEEAVRDHGATPIRELDGPGGGFAATLTDPEGFKIDIITGIEGETPRERPTVLRHNSPGTITRYADPQARRESGPAQLFRLGHIGLYVKDFAALMVWYERVLGLKASDTMHLPGQPDKKIVGFIRLDRGDEWVDHHTLFVGEMGRSDCHHISFEAMDYEAQFIAHQWLLQRGWKPNWGVGRHPLGCHVFDTWFDPDGYRFETFSDTDLVNRKHVAGNYDVSKQQMDIWSSDPPDRYFA